VNTADSISAFSFTLIIGKRDRMPVNSRQVYHDEQLRLEIPEGLSTSMPTSRKASNRI